MSIQESRRSLAGENSPGHAGEAEQFKTPSLLSCSNHLLAALRNLAIVALLAAFPLTPAIAQNLLWIRQTGTISQDLAHGVTVDAAGNVYITGSTAANFGGANAGGVDIFLAKFDTSGHLLWVRQAGTPGQDLATGVAVDGAGNAYITGVTQWSLGGPNAGDWDVFLAKYSSSGTQIWMRQTGSAAEDQATGIAVDGAGNAFITGFTRGNLGGINAGGKDVFLAKYDASGTRLWMRQTGTATDDEADSVAVDSAGNVFITGSTEGILAGSNAGLTDIFLAKYNASGAVLWRRQFGTSGYDGALGVAVDGADNAFVAGATDGVLGGQSGGGADVLLIKYDPSGARLWIRQTGSASLDYPRGLAVDASGNAYIAGETFGDLGGPNAGANDPVLIKYDTLGTRLWVQHIGTAEWDYVASAAVDAAGNAYLAGSTEGSLAGAVAGSYDIFLAKYGPPPCESLADIAGGNGGDGPDGTVNRADFVAFIESFAVGDLTIDPRADVAGGRDTGLSPDGIIDGNDFVAFINAFAAGC